MLQEVRQGPDLAPSFPSGLGTGGVLMGNKKHPSQLEDHLIGTIREMGFSRSPETKESWPWFLFGLKPLTFGSPIRKLHERETSVGPHPISGSREWVGRARA